MKSIKLVILTCDKRPNETLTSVKYSDWPGEINVVKDSKYTSHKEPYYRVQQAVRGIFKDFIISGEDYLLYLEDDVTVNKYLWHNLQNYHETDWLVLCDFGSEADGDVITERLTTAGAQGLLISRWAAEHLLKKKWTAQFDKFLPRTLMSEGTAVHRFIPSIVQHNKGTSAIGGEETVLFSPDFDPTWCSL